MVAVSLKKKKNKIDKKILYTNTFFNKLLTFIKIIYFTIKINPDIIHDSAGSFISISVCTSMFFRLFGPLIITEHDPKPHDGMGYLFYQKLMRYIVNHVGSAYVVHGKKSYSELVKRKIPSSKIRIINHGNYAFYKGISKNNSKRDPFTILFFGALPRPSVPKSPLPNTRAYQPG